MLDYSGFTIAVVGDFMLDVDIKGPVAKISEEFDEPVMLNPPMSFSAGGAGNVAVQMAKLGATVHAYGRKGKDSPLFPSKLLVDSLRSGKVIDTLIAGKTPMTVKVRISSPKRRFVRVDGEDTTPLSKTEVDTMLDPLFDDMNLMDAIVISDYNKGVMTKYCIEQIMADDNVPVMVDPKYDNFWEYRGATIFKSNAKEWWAAEVKDISLLGCDYVLVTNGEKGITIMGDFVNHPSQPCVQHYIPGHKVGVADITGAGDVVMAVLALEYLRTCDVVLRTGDILAAAKLANYAGSLVVQRHGTAHVSLAELSKSGKGI